MHSHTLEQCGQCPICGGNAFKETPVLWDDLIDAWEISHEEVEYINLQQGFSMHRMSSQSALDGACARSSKSMERA